VYDVLQYLLDHEPRSSKARQLTKFFRHGAPATRFSGNGSKLNPAVPHRAEDDSRNDLMLRSALTKRRNDIGAGKHPLVITVTLFCDSHQMIRIETSLPPYRVRKVASPEVTEQSTIEDDLTGWSILIGTRPIRPHPTSGAIMLPFDVGKFVGVQNRVIRPWPGGSGLLSQPDPLSQGHKSEEPLCVLQN
jgi:hypothetical protein